MILTYRYRLLPTKKQWAALEDILESQRQLYNAALEERIDAYRKRGLNRTYFDQARSLTEWRQSDSEGTKCPYRLQLNTLKRVDNAFRDFFRRAASGQKPGFPRFRGRGWFDTFGFRDASRLSFKRGRIRFKGLPGGLRVHLHRSIPSNAQCKAFHFHRSIKGWTILFVMQLPDSPPRRGARAVGVDLGILTFAMLSDGQTIPSLRAARKAERRLRVLQRALARKKRGSRRRAGSRASLARFHATIKNQRMNHLHQAAARLVRDYDTIAIESLNVKGLSEGMRAKEARDAAWGRFISLLRYKAERAGARLIEVDPWQSSQECCRCGSIVGKPLGERVHQCTACGLCIDRDLNAARNILNRAGVGPGLLNVADRGERAGSNTSSA